MSYAPVCCWLQERVTKPSVVPYDPDVQACAQMNDEEVCDKLSVSTRICTTSLVLRRWLTVENLHVWSW